MLPFLLLRIRTTTSQEMRERLLYPLKRSCSIVYQQMLRLVKEFREVFHDMIVEQDKVMGVNMTWRNTFSYICVYLIFNPQPFSTTVLFKTYHCILSSSEMPLFVCLFLLLWVFFKLKYKIKGHVGLGQTSNLSRT